MSASDEAPTKSAIFGTDSEVGRIAAGMDWAATPLGPPAQWSQRLQATVRLVLDSAMPMTLGWGPQFIQIYNDAYLPILGDKHPDALGEPVRQVYPEIWSTVGPNLEAVWATGQAVWRKDKLVLIERRGFFEETYFTFSYSPVRDDQGQVVGVLAAAVETTPEVLATRRGDAIRRLVTAEGAQSVRGVLRALAAPLDSICFDLPVSLICRINEEAREVELVDTTGVVDPGRIDPAGLAEVIPWQALARLEASVGMDADLLRALEVRDDGRPDVGSFRLIPICGDTGAQRRCPALVIVGLSARLGFDDAFEKALIDLRAALERRLNEVRLHQRQIADAENRYRAVFENSLDAMMLTSPTGEILAANPAACELLGYSEDELCELRRTDVVEFADGRADVIIAERAKTGGAQGEVLFIHRSGERIPCEVSTRMYRDAAGRQRTSMVVRDTRQRRELEASLRQAQKLEVVGKLAGGIAHDFNNLLTAIRGAADFLSMECPPGSQAGEDVEIIQEASARAAALTRRLLTFSRSREVKPKNVDLAELVRGVDALLRPLIGEHIELITSLQDESWAVYSDHVSLEQVVLNLAVNARDAMPGGGRLSVGVANVEIDERLDCVVGGPIQPGRFVRLRVEDTGRGMSQETAARIFEPFFTTRQEGTGLGLATVADIVTQYGGHIRLQTELDRGTCFEVWLPASQVGHQPDLNVEAAVQAGDLVGRRVLIVEDQPSVRKAVGRMLGAAGAEVWLAGSADEAIALFDEHRHAGIDLVIADVVMPLVSGPELVRRLREEQPGLAVLFMSGYPGHLAQETASELGAQILMKPFSPAELVDWAHRTLESMPDGLPS